MPGETSIQRGAFELDHDRGTLSYVLLTIEPEVPDRKYPLILILHGTGDRGELYLGKYWIDEAVKNRFMILAPTWKHPYQNHPEELKDFYDLTNLIMQTYPVNKKQIFVAGISSGALIARWLIENDPHFWKGGILLAYGPPEGWSERVDAKEFPPLFWKIGEQDEQLNLSRLVESVILLRDRDKVKIQFEMDPAAGHEHKTEWNEGIFKWLMEIMRGQNSGERQPHSLMT